MAVRRPIRTAGVPYLPQPVVFHPFHELGRKETDTVFGQSFGEWSWSRWTGEASGYAPTLAMLDCKEEVILRADLPGLEQKDIQVTVHRGVLTIRGERKNGEEASEHDHHCCERLGGIFTRGLTLPAGVDTAKVNATFKDGVLEVHLPKTKESKGKMIEITVQ